MKRVGTLLTALAVCGLAAAAMGGQYGVAGANRTGNNPQYRGPQYRVAGQTAYAVPQDSGGQDYAYSGQVYATGYANNAYPGSSCGRCGSCAAGPCGMSYAVPKAPGCCDYSPTCCDHIWDGYCQEKQQRIERWRNFYSCVKSTLTQPPCLGGGYGCGCGRCCGRVVSCQPACGCAASGGMVSEPSMMPSEPAQPAAKPQPQPKAEPKSPPPAPQPKLLKPAPEPEAAKPAVEPEAPPAPEPPEAPAESPAKPALPLPPAPAESSF